MVDDEWGEDTKNEHIGKKIAMGYFSSYRNPFDIIAIAGPAAIATQK